MAAEGEGMAVRRRDDPERMTRGARHAFAILALVVLALGVLCVAFTVFYANSTARGQHRTIARLDAQARRQDAIIAQLRRQQLAQCASYADLGTAVLPAKPPPSRFAVRIVTDNRKAWYGNGCGQPGSLPVPAGLAAAARRYGIPVNGKPGA